MNDEFFESARQWANRDPDTMTSTRLLASFEATEKGDEAALAEVTAVMSGPLEFGTAGLRGGIGPGESRMNPAVVIRTTTRLAVYLKTQTDRAPHVAVDYDARYDSVDFARTAARVLSTVDCHTLALPVKNLTPLTSFAVRALDTDAGIMVTTSHNPAKDNGYKVHLGGTVVSDTGQGAQIVPPHDARVAEAIVACPLTGEVPQDTLNIEDIDPRDDYVAAVTALARGSAEEKAALKITLTAMHGMGGVLTKWILTETGFTRADLVTQQAEPDPDFPTISSPNPEEPGALDLAMEETQRNASGPIIAVNPDADRCAFAIPDPNTEKGQRQLSGNEIGSLLGKYVIRSTPVGSIFANSIVSSRLLERIASERGLSYRRTLVSSKWITCTPGIRFGYEGAIGFCPGPSQARDKDGISTSVVASSLFADLKAKDSSGQKELGRMTRAYGCYLTMPLTFRVDNLELVTEEMGRLHSNPPKELASPPVTEITDLSKGWNGLPGASAITILTETNDRITTRPLGAEPKLRCCLEVILPAEGGVKASWEAVREHLALIKAEFAKAIDI